MKTTLRGPNGMAVLLDSAEIVPNDPGAGTPAMVHAGPYSATYHCALDTGELDGGDYTLGDDEYRWLEQQYETVEAFLNDHDPRSN